MEQQILDTDLTFETGKETNKWAGFWVRFGAYLIDVLVCLPIIALSFYNIYSLKSLVMQIVIDLLLLLYKPIMEYKYGGTLGKMAVKIKVVDLNFEALSLQKAIIRNLPFWLSHLSSLATAILLFQHSSFDSATSLREISLLQKEIDSYTFSNTIAFFPVICCIVIAFTTKKQGVHDMLANTYCVYKESE